MSLLEIVLTQLKSGTIISPFIILYGPGVDNQWETIRQVSQEAAGFFVGQDVLELQDHTSLLKKPHTLKIKKSDTPDDKVLLEHGYDNVGAREVINRLALSPSGNLKILLIEHLERANVAAANALLKSFEEPLAQRIIIASVLNKDAILPTILSRALLIYCDATYQAPELTEEQKAIFDSTIHALDSGEISPLTTNATLIKKESREQDFLSNLMIHFDTIHNYTGVEYVTEALRKISYNGFVEHILFELFMKLLHLKKKE